MVKKPITPSQIVHTIWLGTHNREVSNRYKVWGSVSLWRYGDSTISYQDYILKLKRIQWQI